MWNRYSTFFQFLNSLLSNPDYLRERRRIKELPGGRRANWGLRHQNKKHRTEARMASVHSLGNGGNPLVLGSGEPLTSRLPARRSEVDMESDPL